MKEYVDNPKDFNLNHTQIKDIIYHPWFNNKLQDSWNDKKTACFGCKKVCGIINR